VGDGWLKGSALEKVDTFVYVACFMDFSGIGALVSMLLLTLPSLEAQKIS